MSGIVDDLKKLNLGSIIGAVFILLIVVGAMVTFLVYKKPGTTTVTTNPTPATSELKTAKTEPATQPAQQAAQPAQPSTSAPSDNKVQSTPVQPGEPAVKPETITNSAGDSSRPEGLLTLKALDPDRFTGSSYQVSELQYGTGKVYGTVKNNAQDSHSNITLEITLYDQDGQQTGVSTVKLKGITPGASTRFDSTTGSGPCSFYRVTGYIAS